MTNSDVLAEVGGRLKGAEAIVQACRTRDKNKGKIGSIPWKEPEFRKIASKDSALEI